MAWHNGGDWSVSLQSADTLLAELNAAVTERLNFLNGTSTALETAGDFDDLWIPTQSGADNDLKDKITALRTRIAGLVGAKTRGTFVKASNLDVAQTLGNAIIEAGYPSGTWLSIDRAQNANLWIQMRQVLTEGFVRVKTSFVPSEVDISFSVYNSSAGMQANWDWMLGGSAPPGGTITTGSMTYRKFAREWAGKITLAYVYDAHGETSLTINTSILKGVLISSSRISTWQRNYSLNGPQFPTIQIDGQSFTGNASWARASWPNVGSNTTLTCAYPAAPATIPPPDTGSEFNAATELQEILVWTNIQSALTYG